MALDTAPLLRRKRNVAFALETTTGTAAALANADGVTHIFNPSMNFSTETVERQAQGSISHIRQGKGAQSAAFTFESELVGNEAAGLPIWTRLLRGCGMALNTATFTPVSGATETLTMGDYQHGRLKTMRGAMGTFTLTCRRGQAGRFAWNFMGVPDRPSTTTQILPTYVTTKAPLCGATTFTIGGTTFRVPEVVFEKGNVVILREDISALNTGSDPTGHRAAYITDWATIIRVAPEALPLSTKDWYGVERDSTLSAMSLIIGASANNTFTISAPKLQLLNPPQDGDRNGMMTDDLEFLAVRSADAGEDDLSILFG